MALRLQIPAFRSEIAQVTVNGRPAKWHWVEGLIGLPRAEIQAEPARRYEVTLTWQGGTPVSDPVRFVTVGQNAGSETSAPVVMDWKARLPAGVKLETVDLTAIFNDRVTQIFRNEYRSPRSPFCSLALPKQGLGGWADNRLEFDVDDSGLRAAAAKSGGKLVLPDGVPFETSDQYGGKEHRVHVAMGQLPARKFPCR